MGSDLSSDRVRLGVSACLLGQRVRYDGRHRLDRYLRDVLGAYVEFVPVCPEVECGFPVPRPALRLVGAPEHPRMVVASSGEDVTERMLAWARQRVRELEAEDLSGFVFKSGSPSSGMERVRVYGAGGRPAKRGVGLFARAFMEHFPDLPVEDEARLSDPQLRESFLERVSATARWRRFAAAGSLAGLAAFHAAHELLIMSHGVEHCRRLRRLVAKGKALPREELLSRYRQGFAEALKLRATRRKHANVLYHALGYLKEHLDGDSETELCEAIEQYRIGVTPLVVPLTLLNHHVLRFGNDYLRSQWYLNPRPFEAQLRKRV